MDEEQEVPYTWAKLKEFCNGLSDEQLSQTVRVIREDDSLEIWEASELGDEHYKFDDEDYSFTKDDFDPENPIITPKTNVYLYEKF